MEGLHGYTCKTICSIALKSIFWHAHDHWTILPWQLFVWSKQEDFYFSLLKMVMCIACASHARAHAYILWMLTMSLSQITGIALMNSFSSLLMQACQTPDFPFYSYRYFSSTCPKLADLCSYYLLECCRNWKPGVWVWPCRINLRTKIIY